MIRITDHPNMSSAVYCECYRKIKQTKPFWEKKKCILMLILLEINAFDILNQCLYQNENPTFLPCQVGNTFLSNIFLRFSGCGHRICFVGMAIFHIFLILEEQISVELLVENQKSCLFSSNFSKI